MLIGLMLLDAVVVDLIVKIAVPVILALFSGFVIPWLNAKAKFVKDENARKALEQIIALAGGTVSGIVESLSQTLVKEYVKKGEWNDETKKLVRDEAVRRIKLALTSEQAAAIAAQTQLTIEEWITNKIEAYIHEVDPNKDIK